MHMAKADIWMPLYIGDYLADTTRLTLEQHGAYLLLIMDYWRNGPPPDDDFVLAGICRTTPANWKKLRVALVGFFTTESNQWHHSRIDREIAEAAASKAKAEAKASKAAEARWGKEGAKHDNKASSSNAQSNASSTPQAMHKQCPSPSPSPLPVNPKSKADATASRLPADWKPSDVEIEFCKTERPDLNPVAVADLFRDYWVAQPGVKGRKVDWSATWRNWVRNQRAGQQQAKNFTNKNDRSGAAAAVFGRQDGPKELTDVN
jgi:uncharacterized protein YdaU (DUF1376 family)